jgi:hypothetical protein
MVTRGGSWRSPTTSIMPRPDSSVVERGPEKAGVGGSIPSLATTSKSLTQWALFEKLQKICKRRMPTLSELWCLVNKHPTAANLGFRQMRCRPFKCSSRCWSRQLTQIAESLEAAFSSQTIQIRPGSIHIRVAGPRYSRVEPGPRARFVLIDHRLREALLRAPNVCVCVLPKGPPLGIVLQAFQSCHCFGKNLIG